MKVFVLVIIDIYESITVRISLDKNKLQDYAKQSVAVYGDRIAVTKILERNVE